MITYRPIIWDDLNDVVDTFDETWGEHPDTAVSAMLSRHFVLHYLEPATRGEVAIGDDGTFMGVTLACVAGLPPIFDRVSDELATIDHALGTTSAGLRVLSDTLRWHALEERMEDDIAIHRHAQAEVELFLVAAAARGHGVGGALWRNMLGYFAECGVERYYLHTDSACDVSFYDHQGLARVSERLARDHPEDHADHDGGARPDGLFIYAGTIARK